MSWRCVLLLLAAVVLLTQCGVTCDEPNTVDAALNLRTGDWVDTDFNLNQIVGQAHSISFRFMLQHPNSYYNNIIGESGSGIYTISKNTSASGGCTDRATLSVNFGGTGGVWPNINDLANGFRPNRWYHIAVTVDNQLKLRLYVDGVLGIIQNSGFQTSLQLSGGTWAGGALRFGRRKNSVNPPEQFYGLLDDVAVWDHALSQNEINSLQNNHKLSGNESGLIAGWNFNVLLGGATHPPKHGRPLAFNGNAARVWPLSGKNEEDAAKMLFEQHATKLSLPVKGNWIVNQGSDSDCGSHRGYASFCVDMYYADGPTRGQPIYAAADGTVVLVRDGSADDVGNQQVPGCTECTEGDGSCGYISNEVLIQHAPTEFSSYLHLKQGSVPQAIKDKLAGGQPVLRGEKIGEAGQSGTGGAHLHFAYLWTVTLPANPGINPPADTPTSPCGYTPSVPDSKPLVTRPFLFSEYWAKPQGASAFEFIPAATPQLGDTVRDTSP